MANDFLLTFSVDGRSALNMMDQIAQKATALEARLNNLGKGGTASASVLQSLGLTPAAIQSSNREITTLMGNLDRMSLNKSLGFKPNLSALQAEARGYAQLAQFVGATHPEYQKYITLSQSAAQQANVMSAATEASTSTFGRHLQRIAEAVLIYQALGAAMSGLQKSIGIIIDIDRESRRLQAVITSSTTSGNFGAQQSADFIKELQKTAIQTVTPQEHLLAVADQAASAFLDEADAAKRAADTQELLRDVGKITSVTQRDVATETSNLISIMKLANIPVGDLADSLGKIVVAGGRSSTVIGGLLDALQGSLQAAKGFGVIDEAGKGFDTLVALEAKFLIQTGRTGSEVGNTFKTMFAKITNPEADKAITALTNGVVKLRDANGALRNPIAILVDLNALVDKGIITSTQLNDTLSKIAPPLNPGAKSDLLLIDQLLRQIGPSVRDIGGANADALNKLVDQINAALGPQFQQLIEQVKAGFVNMFGPDILAAGRVLIDTLRAIGDFLNSLPPELVKGVAEFLTLAVALKGVLFLGKSLGAIFGAGGLIAAFKGTGAAGAVAGAQIAGGMGLAEGAARGLAFALKTLVIPLLIEAGLQAIEFFNQVNQEQSGLKSQIGSQIVGKNIDQLKALRQQVGDQLKDVTSFKGIGPEGIAETIGGAFAATPLLESLKEIDKQIAALKEHGGSVSLDALSEGFKATADGASSTADAVSQAQSEFDKMVAGANGGAAALASMTAEEKNNAAATQISLQIADARANAIKKVDNQLIAGKISLEEHTQALANINKASDLAAKLTAVFGAKLGAIPQLQAAAKQGTDKLATALFQLIFASGKNIDSLLAQGQALLQFGLAHAEVAKLINQNPIIIRTIQINERGDNPNLFTQAREGGGNPATGSIVPPLVQNDRSSAILREFQRLIQSFGHAITSQQAATGAQAIADRAPTTRQSVPLLDIGDLPASTIKKIVAIATALRNAIPGETAADKNSVVGLIKDAKLQTLVRGIDDRLLRIALDELTKTEKERLALEKQNLAGASLRNLAVNVGSLGALISQPTTFGVGGSLALGQGLNMNPQMGSFVVNVPVTLNGLQPAALQQMIYRIVAAAFRDALRTG